MGDRGYRLRFIGRKRGVQSPTQRAPCRCRRALSPGTAGYSPEADRHTLRLRRESAGGRQLNADGQATEPARRGACPGQQGSGKPGAGHRVCENVCTMNSVRGGSVPRPAAVSARMPVYIGCLSMRAVTGCLHSLAELLAAAQICGQTALCEKADSPVPAAASPGPGLLSVQQHTAPNRTPSFESVPTW